MLKQPSSRWASNDRSGAWLKLKPDYIKVPPTGAIEECSVSLKLSVISLAALQAAGACLHGSGPSIFWCAHAGAANPLPD